ncbi:MAG: gamma-glutamyltransferase [Rhodospirillales bacterium]
MREPAEKSAGRKGAPRAPIPGFVRKICLFAAFPAMLVLSSCAPVEPGTAPGDPAPAPGASSSPLSPPSTATPSDRAAPDAPKARPVPDAVVPDLPPSKAPARGTLHMVSAANPLAAAAGRDILRRGGSAVDAAIAVQMILTLVEPQSSGIGGGGFLVAHTAASGDIVTYDGRETAPAAAHPYMFLDGKGKPRQYREATVGGLAVGVPGLLRMLEMAHKAHGRLPWSDLFKPAIEMSEKGFAVSERLHAMAERDRRLKTFAPTRDYFFTKDGKPKPVGTRIVNKPLADTLRRIAENGAKAFYTGAIAKSVVAAVNKASVNPGRLKLSDLTAYKAVKRDPVCLAYRVYFVCGMGPPSSGGITLLQILGILQNFDLPNMAPASSNAVHLIAEATRLAYADRNTFIADPEFIPVPAAGLLDPGYLASRAKEIRFDRTIAKPLPGMPGVSTGRTLLQEPAPYGTSTSHISVIDKDGNAVALTSSLQNPFGSRLMVRGFLLNSELTDFSFAPNKDRAPLPNRPEAGKRPLSSMAPTIVFDGSGKAQMVIGSPGGSRIIGYVAKAMIAALDWKMDIQAAVSLPNFTNRLRGTEIERNTALVSIASALEDLGHKVRQRRMTSGLHGILRTKDGLTGGADPRRDGVALGD